MGCGYKIGKLKNFIYLIKDLVYNVVDYKVVIKSGDVYRLLVDSIAFSENAQFNDRFQFNTLVEASIGKVYDDTFIKNNKFKVIVEDVTGMLFLVSPEFDAKYTSEFTINNEVIDYKLIFSTQSNIPTRIVKTKIKGNKIDNECRYNSVGINKLWIGSKGVFEEVDFITCEYKKTYDGFYESILVDFSIDIADNDWHYNLIAFPDNRWDIKIETNQLEVLETLLFPQYIRQYNKITISLRKSQGGSLLGKESGQIAYRWVPTTDFICDGFKKYVKDVKLVYLDGKWVSTNEFRKGLFVESNSTYCGYTYLTIYRWVDLDISVGYMCVGTNKYIKQQLQESLDGGETWHYKDVFRAGDLYLVDSKDCGYLVIDWVADGFICEEYDPSVTWELVPDEYYCELKEI